MYYKNIFITTNVSIAVISAFYYIYKTYSKKTKKERKEEKSKTESEDNDSNTIQNNEYNEIEIIKTEKKEIIVSSIYSLLKEIKEYPTEENLITLANCSAFTQLQSQIFKYDGLPILLELSSNEDINIRICALWNIANCCTCDGINKTKYHLESCNENEICHTLRIYQNISVLNEISEELLFIVGKRVLKLLSLNNSKFNKNIMKMLVNMSCNINLHEILIKNNIFDVLISVYLENDNNDEELVINTLYIVKNILSSSKVDYLKKFKESGLYFVLNKVRKENDLRLCIMKMIESINIYIYNEILNKLN